MSLIVLPFIFLQILGKRNSPAALNLVCNNKTLVGSICPIHGEMNQTQVIKRHYLQVDLLFMVQRCPDSRLWEYERDVALNVANELERLEIARKVAILFYSQSQNDFYTESVVKFTDSKAINVLGKVQNFLHRSRPSEEKCNAFAFQKTEQLLIQSKFQHQIMVFLFSCHVASGFHCGLGDRHNKFENSFKSLLRLVKENEAKVSWNTIIVNSSEAHRVDLAFVLGESDMDSTISYISNKDCRSSKYCCRTTEFQKLSERYHKKAEQWAELDKKCIKNFCKVQHEWKNCSWQKQSGKYKNFVCQETVKTTVPFATEHTGTYNTGMKCQDHTNRCPAYIDCGKNQKLVCAFFFFFFLLFFHVTLKMHSRNFFQI